MANDMTPKRGYDFKSKSTVDPVRLQTELDRIFTAFAALRAFLDISLDGDGELKGSTVGKRNLRDGVFRDQEQAILDQAQRFLDDNTQINRSVQDFLTRTMDVAREARHFSDEARSALGQALDALSDVKKLETLVNSGRSRAEAATQQASVRAADAATSSASARIAEDMAYRWAEKMDGPVYVPENGDPVDDGFYSAKWWANWTKTQVEFGSFWYLGPKPSPPTEGNNGVPLQPGMWYFDTTDGIGYIWDGTNWLPMTSSSVVLSVFGRTGNVVAQVADYAAFYSQLGHTHLWSEITDKPSTFPPDAHTHTEAEITDLDRIRWRGTWVSQEYQKNDAVLDGNWLMVANKITSDKAGPIESGNPQWDLPDAPAWVTNQHTGVVRSGREWDVLIPSVIKEYQVWAPTLTNDTNYTIFTYSYPTGNPDLATINQVSEPLLVEDGWATVRVDTVMVLPGTTIGIILDALNSGSDSTVTGGWTRAANSNDPALDPGIGQWGGQNSDTLLRISTTDADSTDRETELLGMVVGTTIVFADTLNPNLSVTYRVVGAPLLQSTTHVSYTVELQDTGASGRPLIGSTTTMTATVPVASPTDYVQLVGGNPAANTRGILVLDGVDQNVPDDAFGVRIRYDELLVSDDWDAMALSGGSGGSSGGGGGATSFDELRDTPDTYAGASNKVVAVKSDESGLEFVDPGGGGGGASVTIGDTFPLSPSVGDLHYKTSAVVGLYVYYDDGSSLQWVQSNGSVNADSGDTVQIVDEGSGYQIVGSKLIQWGISPTASGIRTITLPVPYASYDVYTATGSAESSPGSSAHTVHCSAYTDTTFDLRVKDNSGGNPSVQARWITVGDAPAGREMPTELVGFVNADDYLPKSGGIMSGFLQCNAQFYGNGYSEFTNDLWVYNTAFVQRYAPDDGWTGYGWANSTGFTYWYLGLEPNDNDMVMEQYDGAGNFLRNVYRVNHSDGSMDFFYAPTFNDRAYVKIDPNGNNPNDTGVVWQDADAAVRGYMFWRDDVTRLQYNVYDDSSNFIRQAFYVNEADSYFNVTSGVLRIRTDSNSLVSNPFLQFYRGTGEVTQLSWNVGWNDGDHSSTFDCHDFVGNYQGRVQFDGRPAIAGVRVTAGEFYADAPGSTDVSKYYGSDTGFAARLQTRLGGFAHFGDIGFVQLLAGGGGPVGVYLAVGNTGNAATWGFNADFTSDISTKNAVQPSPVEALDDIMTLSPIRWTYNEKAKRLHRYRSNFDEVDHPNDLVVEDLGVHDDSDHHVELGFTSQDIKRIAPDAVYELDGIERIDYRLVVPHCLKAIQQLVDKISELEAKIDG